MSDQGKTMAAMHQKFLESLSTFTREHRARYWEGDFATFLEEIVTAAPGRMARTSHEYFWDMLRWTRRRDERDHGTDQLFSNDLFGIDASLQRIVDYFKAASAGSEVGRRLLLLLGPPSGGKSTLVILLKRGLEEYSQTEEGALYGIKGCPLHESPLHLIPHTLRAEFRDTYGVEMVGELCPYCQSRLEHEYDRDFMQMPVERIFISESGRVGV